MKKFESHIDGSAEIEIANAFHSPGLMHLNRYLIPFLSTSMPDYYRQIDGHDSRRFRSREGSLS